MIELEELVTLSKELKLSGLKNNLVKYLDDAEKNKETYREFLYKVLKSEIDKRAQDAENKRIKKARFPYLKNIDTFDLTFQTSIDLQKIKILKELKWVDDAYNLIFLGPPGVGKTHLLIGIGEYAARNGYHVLFINMEDLIYYLKNRDHDRKSKEIYN